MIVVIPTKLAPFVLSSTSKKSVFLLFNIKSKDL